MGKLKYFIIFFSIIVISLGNIAFAFPIYTLGILAETSFVYPVVRPRLSSKYGSRVHPIYKVIRHHSGVDLAAPLGSPVRAMSAGTVVFADPYGGYGNLIVIQHKSGVTSHYGHLDKIRVKIGEKVSSGQIIATVGSTGKSTGPHLHLELRHNGKLLDPIKMIPALTAQAEG